MDKGLKEPEIHKNIHDLTKTYECNICSYRALTLQKLNKHQKIHIEETKDERYQCYFCPSDFMHKSVLEQHENTHTGDKPYKCGECSSTFSLKQSLGLHMMIHKNSNRFPCYFCPSAFPKRLERNYHENIHTGEKPFKCNICESAFNFKQAWKNHLKSHSHEKAYKCDKCAFITTTVSKLNKHEMIHKKLRSFIHSKSG